MDNYQSNENISEAKTLSTPDNIEDYSTLLEKYGITYQEDYPYLYAGEIKQTQGWILHISISRFQIMEAFNLILPLLIRENIPFKIPADFYAVTSLCSGRLGYELLGKIITIYPGPTVNIISITKHLVLISSSIKGISIPTDFYLGGSVYTRYGGFDPIVKMTQEGIYERFIYDQEGNLIKDNYSIPFRLPKDIEWPFKELVEYKPKEAQQLLNGKYLHRKYLKKDLKGDVTKVFDASKWYLLKSYIIKQGKKHSSIDVNGRDIIDRLKWQYELHKTLQDKISMPKAIDYFEIDGDGYLVTQFVKGLKLNSYIITKYNGGNWLSLGSTAKLDLLNCFEKIVALIGELHDLEVVHRDLNASNYIITKGGNVVITDFELSYSLLKEYPNPPFGVGTPGYMSPEQIDNKIPTKKEDIFALGALLLYGFTAIFPSRFNVENESILYDQILFFTQETKIANLICQCLNKDPDKRPSAQSLKDSIVAIKLNTTEVFSKKVPNSEKNISYSNPNTVDPVKCTKLIIDGLLALGLSNMIDSDGIWISKPIEKDRFVTNDVTSFCRALGLSRGIAGVMYLIANAKKLGYNLENLSAVIQSNWEELIKQMTSSQLEILPGLYYGTSGILLAIKRSQLSTTLEQSEILIERIIEGLLVENKELNLESGIAGQGIAILLSEDLIGLEKAKNISSDYIDIIINSQLNDGSWLFSNPDSPEQKLKFYGFSCGAAGIIWFLLEYYKKFKLESAKLSAIKGLNWLSKKSIKNRKNKTLQWTIEPTSKHIDLWFDIGYSGISLCFIKAYEVLGVVKYRNIAESILRNHPKDLTSIHFGYGNGLVGIGEIYLEAYHVFQDVEWFERAGWIANLLIHTYSEKADGQVYWRTNESSLVTPDLMDGNSGLLNFLLRFSHPKEIPFMFTCS